MRTLTRAIGARFSLAMLAALLAVIAGTAHAQQPDARCLQVARVATDSLAKLHVASTVLTQYQVRAVRVLDSLHAARCVTSVPVPPPDTVPTPPDTTPAPPDTTPPPPPPPPPPVPTRPAWAQAVDRILGPIPNCAQLATTTGPLREWYDKWQQWEPVRWKADSSRWDAANYYDRASIYYAMAVCELPHDATLSARYRARADALAVDYRDKYLAPNDGGASAHWSQLEGVALHALITGDAASRRLVGRTADVLATTAYYTKKVFGDTTHIDMENRIAQRAILAALLAQELAAPGKSFPASRWPGVLDTLITLTARAQRADGAWAYRCKGGVCGLEFPYMDALLLDVLIRTDALGRHDARVNHIVRTTIDHHLAVAIRADSSWKYNVRPSTLGSASASPDLNGLHPANYAWLAAQTGDTTYLARVAPLFLKGVRATYYAGQKQFNQQFYSSYRYVAMRQAATVTP